MARDRPSPYAKGRRFFHRSAGDRPPRRASSSGAVLGPLPTVIFHRNVTSPQAMMTMLYTIIGPCRHIPELLLWNIFLCIPLAVFLSEIIASGNELYYPYTACVFYLSVFIVKKIFFEFLLISSVIQRCLWLLWLTFLNRERPKTTYSLACTCIYSLLCRLCPAFR